MKKSRSSIFKLISGIFKEDRSDLSEILISLEEILISSDLGIKLSTRCIDEVREKLKDINIKDINYQLVSDHLKDILLNILKNENYPELVPTKRNGQPQIVLIVGVNGVGKTTTIGKLAFQLSVQNAKVLIGACDTFRAAAGEQSEVWANRSGVAIERGAEGEKPSTVAYRTIKRALEEDFDVVLIDTAGRLHTRSNLMNELAAVVNIVSREVPSAPHETFLVIDGTTGQNGLQQAIEFNQKAKLTGVVVTKLDGTAKGGIVLAISDSLKIPIKYVGVGEGLEHLHPFDDKLFVKSLLDEETEADQVMPISSERAAVRRRRRETD